MGIAGDGGLQLQAARSPGAPPGGVEEAKGGDGRLGDLLRQHRSFEAYSVYGLLDRRVRHPSGGQGPQVRRRRWKGPEQGRQGRRWWWQRWRRQRRRMGQRRWLEPGWLEWRLVSAYSQTIGVGLQLCPPLAIGDCFRGLAGGGSRAPVCAVYSCQPRHLARS